MTDMFPMLDGVILLSNLLLFVLGLAMLAVLVLFVIDITQTADAVRRNYPVIGRFRALFQTLGEFFRQYFFAMDREEMPFNRAEREWIKKSAHGEDNTAAFGSTRSLNPPGTAIFVNAPYPVMDEHDTMAPAITIGADTPSPYAPRALLNISAMSYGSISKPAILALSRGARRAGCWLNTGEGGLSPYHLDGGCDIVFQIGTAKYGVRTEAGGLDEDKLRAVAAHDTVRMFEVKLSQGAKPGKGGLLPGSKITAEIAKVRGIPEGEDSVSPNRHPEIPDNGALLDFIDRVRTLTGKPTGIKTVVSDEAWMAALCAEIERRGPASAPDFITVDSGDGGTGAAPMPLMDNCGLPIREALPLVIDALVRAGLRDRVKVIASGKLVTPAEVAWAYCAGADFVNSARGFMFALGCIQSLKCNKNTCPTGITTHDRRLQKGLDPAVKSERVARFVRKMEYGVNLIAHSCGAEHPRALRRHHVRLVQGDGRSVPMSTLWPDALGRPAA